MTKLRFLLFSSILVLLGSALGSPAAAGQPARRGLWVLCEGSQRVLEHPAKVAVLLKDARAMGVTDLFVQVYRGGRAWYDSSLADPTPYQKVFRQGDRDGLQLLIEGAHRQGLRVHAWVNVLSLAKNRSAPILSAIGRRAAAVDQHGRSVLDYPDLEVPQPDRQYYRMGTPAVWLDPAAPGVRERLVATFEELVLRYPGLDGLHLDYIRYPDVLPFVPGARFGVGLSFGYGEPSRARFLRETGLTAPLGKGLQNANAWDVWRREQVSRVVSEIARAGRQARPGLEISAAVISDRERAYLADFQNWLGWLDEGHLDFAVPMLYTTDDARLEYAVESYEGLARGRRMMVGLGSWLFASNPERALGQLRRVEASTSLGSALFSWDSIREHPRLLQALSRPRPASPPRPAAVESGPPKSLLPRGAPALNAGQPSPSSAREKPLHVHPSRLP